MPLVIGVPRALLYHSYWPFYQRFFDELGIRLLVSPPTDRSILEAGTQEAVGDTCLPVKLHIGHCRWLSDKVDLLFVPRIVSVRKRTYLCPKIIGLPDMTQAVAGLPPILAPIFDLRQPLKTLSSWLAISRQLGKPSGQVLRSLQKAMADKTPDTRYQTPEVECREQSQGRLKVGVVGHRYLIHDDFVSMRLLQRLKAMGVDPVTIDDLHPHLIDHAQSTLPKPLFWSASREMLGSGLHFLNSGQVDGVVVVVAFACGTDAFTNELLERQARDRSKAPLLILSVDEHTGEAGFITRLEAFVDLLQRRRASSASHLSPHGALIGRDQNSTQ